MTFGVRIDRANWHCPWSSGHRSRFTGIQSALIFRSARNMTPFLRKLLGLNWLLLANMLALAIFGVVAIYSATYMREDSVSAEFWRKQASWVAVGFFAFMVTSLIDYRWIRLGALPMYLAGFGFLDSDQVHGDESLRIAQLAPSGADQLSARAAGGRRGNHGPRLVSESVPRDASHASFAALRGDCRSAVSSNSYAT